MTYFQFIVAAFQSLWSLKNIRLVAIFKGQDYAQSEGENPITAIEDPEEADLAAWNALPEKERTILEDTMYKQPEGEASLKELTWDKWSLDEKVFYLELKKGNAISAEGIPTKPAPTQSEEFLDSLKNLKIDTGYLGVLNVGKYIGWATPIINFLFSPTFLRIVSVGAAIGMLFTPFGYGVGALALTVALVSVAVDIYRYTAKYRELNDVKEESVLLNELKKESATLENTLSKSTDVFRNIIATTMPGHSINPHREAPSVLRAAGYTAIGAYSNMVVSSVLSIATLNPIPILASMLMMVTGYSVTTAMYYQFDKRFTYLCNANDLMKAELGLDHGFAPGGRNMFLSNHLNMMRRYNLAVAKVAEHPEASKPNPDRELLRDMLVEAFNHEVMLVGDAKRSPRPSFLQDTWTLFKDGVSWTTANRRFTPSFMEAGVVSHHSTEAFNERREKGINTISETHEKFKGVLAQIAKPQPEIEPTKEEKAADQPTLVGKIAGNDIKQDIPLTQEAAIIEDKGPEKNRTSLAEKILASKLTNERNSRH